MEKYNKTRQQLHSKRLALESDIAIIAFTLPYINKVERERAKQKIAKIQEKINELDSIKHNDEIYESLKPKENENKNEKPKTIKRRK